MKPEELEKELRTGITGSLYYFHGEEPFLIERGVKRLLEKVVPSDFREFNYTIFYGGEAKGEAIVEAAQTLPMFAPLRVVLVRRAGALSPAALDLLTDYVADPSPYCCLIMQGDKIDQRRKLFAELKKKGRLVEYKRPYENQLGFFIREEAALSGKRIEPAAAELLGYFIGTNLQELAAQIEKIALYVGEREIIRLEDAREMVSDAKVNSVFDLNNALGEKDLGKSLRSFQTIIRDGESPLMVLNMMTRHFRQLWQVRELVDRKVPAPEIGKAAGLNPYFAGGVISQAREYGVAELREIFEELHSVDLALKTGGGRAVDLMERLIVKICSKRRSGY